MEGGAAGDELDTGGDGHQHETVDYSLSFPTETVPLYTVHVQYIHYVYVHVTQVYVYTYMYNYAHLDVRFVVCHTYKKLANVNFPYKFHTSCFSFQQEFCIEK